MAGLRREREQPAGDGTRGEPTRTRPYASAGREVLDKHAGPFNAVGPSAADEAPSWTKTSEEAEEERAKEPPKLDAIDILAFIIAFFQLLLPPFLVMAGVLFLLYLLFRLWAGV